MVKVVKDTVSSVSKIKNVCETLTDQMKNVPVELKKLIDASKGLKEKIENGEIIEKGKACKKAIDSGVTIENEKEYRKAITDGDIIENVEHG
tara:strand:+ start:475 stop:750 length:276 start_codon:yes stop_codon:yes gene_type:complete